MQEIGARIGAFEILAPLGAGGMGEVYRARDPRLEREVALKVLPATTEADDTARKRLLREARLASKLNHPHICTIYEVGEDNGQLFIAMELVSGEALSARLSSEPLATDEVQRLGCQMADALAHAHANGLVHRDFKSGNVVITPDGRTKILDFGLAARVSEEELSEATTYSVDSLELSGKIVGTLAYMAPEQLKGEGADARSDIWALGVVLYEMASGNRPFKGKTGFELSSEILSAAPEPLPQAPDGTVPFHLQAVIDRCLEKDPARRFQSAGEVREALEMIGSTSRPEQFTPRHVAGRSAGGRGRARLIRMAVLPFANFSGDPEQEYLSDGFTQEMITQLGKLHPEGLSVIARTSVMRYKGGDTPIDRIGRELSADYILEGSTRREGDRVRINAELIHVGDQTQLWAESFEREFLGILKLQSEVAERVAEALSLTLLPSEKRQLAEVRPVSPAAHEAYLRGVYHCLKVTPEDLDQAEDYFDLALKKDPSYAPAFAGRASVWVFRNQMGFASPADAGPKAKVAALRALELDANSADAHHVLAMVRTYVDWDWDRAGESWRQTLELNPNVAGAQVLFAHYLAITGHVEEARIHSEKAAILDPFNPLVQCWHAQILLMQRKVDEAMAVAREAQRIQPDHPIVKGTLWLTMDQKEGMDNEAFEAAKGFTVAVYQDPRIEAEFDKGYAQGGYAEAMKRGAESLVARLPEAFCMPMDIGSLFVVAGENDDAIDWFGQGLEIHDPSLPYLSCFPMFDEIRSDPRFQDLLRRMNLPSGLENELPAKSLAVAPQQPAADPVRTRRRRLFGAVGVVIVLALLLALEIGGVRQLLVRGFGAEVEPIRIAVLPFANLSGDPGQEYLSDGLTQEMITQLGRLHPEGLSVIARSSVMRYKGGDTPIDRIGEELQVDYVLEGSAQREVDRIRVNAELIHVGNQTQLWADTFEREFAGILVVQSEVARRVADALALKLLPAERARLGATQSVDPDAYEDYLKGTYYWQKLTPDGVNTAEHYFNLALEKDTSYAPAWEGLAWVWAVRQQLGMTPPDVAGPKAKAAALRAVALEDSSAGAHEALALVRTWTDWDWAGAEPEWRRALELNPNAASAHAYYAHFLAIIERTEEVIQHSERALELDPFNALFQGLYGIALCREGRFDDAGAAARAALALQPDQLTALQAAWWSAAPAGLHAEAVAAAQKWLDVGYGDPALGQILEQGWAAGGYTEAMRRSAIALAERYETSWAAPYDIASLFVEAGEHDQALDWLELAYRDHDPNLPYLGAPIFAPLFSDPRFQDLLRRMNLPPSKGEVG